METGFGPSVYPIAILIATVALGAAIAYGATHYKKRRGKKNK